MSDRGREYFVSAWVRVRSRIPALSAQVAGQRFTQGVAALTPTAKVRCMVVTRHPLLRKLVVILVAAVLGLAAGGVAAAITGFMGG